MEKVSAAHFVEVRRSTPGCGRTCICTMKLMTFNEIEPEQVARTLRTFETPFQYDSDQEQDSVSNVISWQIDSFNLSLSADELKAVEQSLHHTEP